MPTKNFLPSANALYWAVWSPANRAWLVCFGDKLIHASVLRVVPDPDAVRSYYLEIGIRP